MKSEPLITYRRPPATLKLPRVEQFARVVRDRVARGRLFHCLVTGDAELRLLNLRFRGKDAATDVLSFPSGEKDPIGDIAISLGRARAQARERGHTIENEICILMLHGVLHLLGMDHESDNGRMARAELRWQRTLGLPAGLIERTAAAAS
jgi:probable rRNA maturation factor